MENQHLTNEQQYTAAVEEYSRLKEELYLNPGRSPARAQELRTQMEIYERREA